MAFTPGRGHESLRRGRWSVSQAVYFITICTRDRKPGLTAPGLLTNILDQLQSMENEGSWLLSAAVIIPDHIHVLAEISEPPGLAGAVRLFKGRLTPLLRNHGLSWQQAYFDHRMRTDEDLLPVFLYIFLNPYRANLLPKTQRWPGYYCSTKDWKWFEAMTEESLPMPEWLA
jgi:putative transposase